MLDDSRIEALTRRIAAAGAVRLYRVRSNQPRGRMRWDARVARRLAPLAIAAGLAAVVALARNTEPPPPPAPSQPAHLGAELGLRVPDRQSLLAAAVGAVSEEEFLSGLWGHQDADALLAASEHP
ncbi:MAG TPA: hypothetical protein VFW98_07365 [Gemmatimonadaceae bacterium]|nr:hypothetical protein [Gemmatimonadaceae bacterium]